MRPCDLFLHARGHLLGDHGFRPDPGVVEHAADCLVFYHYSRPDRIAHILAPGSGLVARRPVVDANPPPALVEGFLEPLPAWLTNSPYFGDLGFALLCGYIGDVLLRVELPRTVPVLYIADYAHMLECKHVNRRGGPALDLGDDCTSGREVTQAYVHSYIPASTYTGGHVCPVIQVVRRSPALAVPAANIRVADQ